MKHSYISLLGVIVLAACSPKSTDTTETFTGVTIELPVTAQVNLPEKGVAYAFVPNDAAQWLSQIVILSEDGDLYQSTADTRMAKAIDGPKVKSILGLNRPGAPGMFLAVDAKTNQIHSFVESNDDGDFRHVGIIETAPSLKAFCPTTPTPVSDFSALTLKGKQQRLSIDMDNDAVVVSPGEISREQECAESSLSVGLGGVLADNETRLEITNGISIPGVPNPQSVYTVSENFGGPFNNGLVLVSDADEPRFVVISADFARKTLGADLN